MPTKTLESAAVRHAEAVSRASRARLTVHAGVRAALGDLHEWGRAPPPGKGDTTSQDVRLNDADASIGGNKHAPGAEALVPTTCGLILTRPGRGGPGAVREVLLVRHNGGRDWYRRHRRRKFAQFDFPGGHVEYRSFERWADGLLREWGEEVGVVPRAWSWARARVAVFKPHEALSGEQHEHVVARVRAERGPSTFSQSHFSHI